MALPTGQKHGHGTQSTKMNVDKSAKNTPNASKLVCPICLPNPKRSGFQWEKASIVHNLDCLFAYKSRLFLFKHHHRHEVVVWDWDLNLGSKELGIIFCVSVDREFLFLTQIFQATLDYGRKDGVVVKHETNKTNIKETANQRLVPMEGPKTWRGRGHKDIFWVINIQEARFSGPQLPRNPDASRPQTPGRLKSWFTGTNDLSTKRLMFQVLSFL